jgi:lactoylglutathione lyase
MEFKGLRTCIYKVNDLGKAKAWYSEALGFAPYFDEPFYVGYNGAGYELGLIPDEGNPATHEGGVHTYWGVDDVEAMFQRLLGMGASAYEAPNEVGGGIVVGMVKDPWGNLFGMIYNPHFSLPE